MNHTFFQYESCDVTLVHVSNSDIVSPFFMMQKNSKTVFPVSWKNVSRPNCSLECLSKGVPH